MAMNVGYIARETTRNLWRNATLTIASVLTIVVSLGLLGSALLTRGAVDNATDRWEEGIEFVVWMNPDATPEQDEAIRSTLEQSPAVDTFIYANQAEALEEFKGYFGDQPELLDNVSAADLPPSYRVVPVDPDPRAIDELASTFEDRPGVRDVSSADEIIKEMQRMGDKIGNVALLVAVVVLGIGLLLTLNTIIMAIGSRQREIEVMKLVGATNWFIRIPFVLEGVVFGVVGALGAIGLLKLFEEYIINELNSSETIVLLSGFEVTSAQFSQTALIMLLAGIGVASIGSGVAVTRHLDV
jgi:cell division transport system permease protein